MNRILFMIGFCSAFFFNDSVQARNLIFTLDCKWSVSAARPATDPDYQVVKTAIKRNGKWENQFTVKATPRTGNTDSVVYNLEEASGDADYLVYKALNDDTETLGWITIQNKFKWATIDTSEGNYSCR